MPARVRNFFMEADVDGRQTDISTGPRSRDGGMNVHIYQRDRGSVTDCIRIASRAGHDGSLTTSVFGPDGSLVFEHTTER